MSNALSEYLGLLDELRTTIGSDPATLPPARRLISQAGRVVCRGYSTNPVVGGIGPVGATLREVCFDYYNGQNYVPPTKEQGFNGGQCDNVQYNVTATFRRLRCDGTVQSTTESGSGRGPLTFFRTRSQFNADRTSWAEGVGIRDRFGTAIVDGGAAIVAGCSGTTSNNFSSAITMENVSITRSDGLADNCGNPPPTNVPGTAPTYTFGDTVVVQDDEGFDVPIEVGEPFIDEDGNIRIPFKIGDAEFDLLSVPGQGNQPKSDLPLSTGNTTGELNPDGTADALEEPAEGQERAGVLIEVIGEETKTGQIFGTAPYGVFPRVNGNATLLATSSEDSADIPGTSVRLLSRFTLLLTDVPGLQVDRVFVSLASPSFRYKLTTIFRNIEA